MYMKQTVGERIVEMVTSNESPRWFFRDNIFNHRSAYCETCRTSDMQINQTCEVTTNSLTVDLKCYPRFVKLKFILLVTV